MRAPLLLTLRQAAFWLTERARLPLSGASPLLYVEFESVGLDLDRLESSWSRVVAAHPELCSAVDEHGHFTAMGGRYASPMRRIDLRGDHDEAATLAEVRRLILAENLWLRQRPCRLSATLLDNSRARVHLQFNSARIDHFSALHLLRDWRIAFAEPKLGGCSGTHPKVVRERGDEEDELARLRGRSFWERRERDLPPPPDLPLMQAPHTIDQPRFERFEHRFAPEIAKALEQRAREANVSLASALRAAYASVIAAWSAEPHFTLSLASFDGADAPHRGAKIGDGCSLSLVAVDAASETTFAERARALHESHAQAHAHRHEGSLTAARRARGGNGYPVVFTDLLSDLLGAEGFASAGSWLGRLEQVRARTPQVWLDCQARNESGALALAWDHPRGLFDDGTLREMFDAFISLISDLADEASWKVGTTRLSHQLLPGLRRSAASRRLSLMVGR